MQRSSVAPDMHVLVLGKPFFFFLFLFVWKGNNHAFGQGTQTKYCYFNQHSSSQLAHGFCLTWAGERDGKRHLPWIEIDLFQLPSNTLENAFQNHTLCYVC